MVACGDQHLRRPPEPPRGPEPRRLSIFASARSWEQEECLREGTKCKSSRGLAECMVGLQAGTRAEAENLPRVPADKRARVRLARARQQKLAVERRLLLNTGSWVRPNELQAGSTACAFSGPWCQHTACPHQLLHLPCSAAQDQAQEAASRFHRRPGQRQSGWCQEAKLHAHVYVYTCVCVCVPSRVNISGLPSPIPGPHIHSAWHQAPSELAEAGE